MVTDGRNVFLIRFYIVDSINKTGASMSNIKVFR